MMQLTPYQRTLHARALSIYRTRERCDRTLVVVLQKIEKQQRLGYADLFSYLRGGIEMPPSTAYAFKSVTLRALAVPQLDRALRAGRLSVFRASRMMSVLNAENADYLIEFACTHTEDELDLEVARINPNPRRRTVARIASGDHCRLSTDLKLETHAMLCRARALLGQKEVDEVLGRVLSEWLDRNDPVRKADRAKARRTREDMPDEASATEAAAGGERKPLNAEQNHAVNHRDRGRCTFVTMDGKRCPNECWTEIHHVRPVSEGGTNDPNNLTTLCSYHHAMVHQLRKALDSGRPES